MSRRVLVVQWLNGNLRALHLNGKDVIAASAQSLPIDGVEQFREALPRLVEEVGYNGGEAVLVIENRRLVYHLQEAPPGRRVVVTRYLERQVEKGMFFDGEPAGWGVGPPISVKGAHRYLLTLLPREWVISLRESFQEQGLHLFGVFSSATVLARNLLSLPLENERPALLMAEIEGVLCLVVGKRNGHVWFARSVSQPSGPPPADASSTGQPLRVVRSLARGSDRLEQELNRTRLFCQQQFETQISKLWIIGDGAARAVSQTQLPDGLALEIVPTGSDQEWLARHASSLGASSPGNLLDQVQGEDLRQRRVLACGATAAVGFSFALLLFANHLIAQRKVELQGYQDQSAELRKQHEATLEELRQAKELKVLIAAVGNPADPDVASLFCRYLGLTLPADFALNQLELQQGTNGWTVRLDGRCRDADQDLLGAVETLEKQLTGSPFKLNVLASTRTRLFSSPGDHSRPSLPVAVTPQSDQRPFFIEGIIP